MLKINHDQILNDLFFSFIKDMWQRAIPSPQTISTDSRQILPTRAIHLHNQLLIRLSNPIRLLEFVHWTQLSSRAADITLLEILV